MLDAILTFILLAAGSGAATSTGEPPPQDDSDIRAQIIDIG